MTAVGTQQLPQTVLEWIDAGGNVNNLAFDVVVSEEWDEGATVTEHPVETGANVADHVRVTLPKCELQVRSTNEPIDVNNFDQATSGQQQLFVRTPYWTVGSGVFSAPDWNNPILARALVATAGGVVGGAIGGALGNNQLGGVAGLIAGIAAAQLALPAQAESNSISTDAGLAPPDSPPSPPQVTVQQWPGKDYVEMTHALLVQLKNSAQLIDVIGTKQVEFDMVIETLTFLRDADTGTGENITIGLKKVRIVSTKTVAAPIPFLAGGGGTPPTSHGNQDPQDAPQSTKSAAVSLLQSLGISF